MLSYALKAPDGEWIFCKPMPLGELIKTSLIVWMASPDRSLSKLDAVLSFIWASELFR